MIKSLKALEIFTINLIPQTADGTVDYISQLGRLFVTDDSQDQLSMSHLIGFKKKKN